MACRSLISSPRSTMATTLNLLGRAALISHFTTMGVMAQLNQTTYFIYQSQSQISSNQSSSASRNACSGLAVAVQGQVIGDFFSVQGADSENELSCSQETFCLLDPSSSQCQNMTNGVIDPAQLSITTRLDGQISECDTSNTDIGQDLCTIAPQPCRQSSKFPSCTYTLLTGPGLLAAPQVLLNENLPPSANETLYWVFYTDSDCTDFGAMRGLVEDTPTTFPRVDGTKATCLQSLACLLNPTGTTCNSLPHNGTSTFTYTRASDGTKQLCSEASGDCETVERTSCTPSPVFLGCYEKPVPAEDLFQFPQYFITPPKPVQYSLNSTYYTIYYSGSGRCSGTAIAANGNVIGDSNDLQKAKSDDGNCAFEVSCALDPFSNPCFFTTLGLISTAKVNATYTETDSLLVCNSADEDNGQQLCTENPKPCRQSSLYPSCSETIVTGTELAALPNVLLNEDPPEEVDHSAYIVMYTDPSCVSFGALRGIVLDTYNYFPKVDDLPLYTCQDTLVCFVSPQGSACNTLAQYFEGRMVYLTLDEETQSLLQCDVESESCLPVNQTACFSSTLYPGCYFRVVWGTDMLQNPIKYITPPTDSPSAYPSSAPSESPTDVPTNAPSSSPAKNANETPEPPIGGSSAATWLRCFPFVILVSLASFG